MSSESQLSAFKFGAGGNGTANSVSASALDTCFKASPPQDRIIFGPPLAGPPRQRQLSINTSQIRSHGSPNHAHSKKAAASFQRPRKQFRRSLSMFEHPGDVIKQDVKEFSPNGLQSIMDVDDTHALKLPHFIPTDEPGSLPRINHGTLIGVLNGDYDHLYDQTMLVDCRFEYEYNGGHIDGADNFNDKEELAKQLFEPAPSSNTLLIFHCEFSKQRAPLM
jgi:M-phase inducer tyrosine phosphatase